MSTAVARLQLYYSVVKPGIIYGNLLAATAGFLLAAKGHPSLGLLIYLLVGTSLVIASACAVNNYTDQGIDQNMARTKQRALVRGDLSGTEVLLLATILGVAGFGLLWLRTNSLVTLLGLVGFVDYTVLYAVVKRRSTLSTLIGSVSGAIPPVAGYCAVSGRLDLGAWLLFVVMAMWQMGHFYAIALYRYNDYKAAGLPLLPVVKQLSVTRQHIIGFISVYIIAATLLFTFGYTGYVYVVIVAASGLYWLRTALGGLKTLKRAAWGKRLFLQSLIVLLVWCLMLSVDHYLP